MTSPERQRAPRKRGAAGPTQAAQTGRGVKGRLRPGARRRSYHRVVEQPQAPRCLNAWRQACGRSGLKHGRLPAGVDAGHRAGRGAVAARRLKRHVLIAWSIASLGDGYGLGGHAGAIVEEEHVIGANIRA